MQSVLEEIKKLRNDSPITIDYNNSNRYRLVVEENDESKTAYYFNTPIYNQKTRKMIDLKFELDGDYIHSTGSNAKIILFDNILMENAEGVCKIELPQRCDFISAKQAICRNIILMPTANGLALKCAITQNDRVSFVLEVDKSFLSVRANDKYFALMRDRFAPFAVFSCVGSLDSTDNVIAPAKIEYQKLTDNKYKIFVSAISPFAQDVLFEVNLYENKLFQDTTVESMNPTTNNAFGSVGFIGNSSAYGEQWLYSRLDYSKIPEIMDKRIQKSVLHIPTFNNSTVELSAFRASARFCSFGSNWNNKIAGYTSISDSYLSNGYQNLNLTPLFIDPKTKMISKNEGIILKSKIRGSGFSVVSTGDSYLCPQILEINYY